MKKLEALIRKNRSCRRFSQNHKIEFRTLKSLVNLARLSPSAANLQPLKFIINNQPEKNETIFSCLGWAAYLKDWKGPAEGEKPSAYILVLGDTAITKNFGCDHGIASHSILLGAREMGLAGCMIGSINRKRLMRELNISNQFEILLVLALGKPTEEVVLEAVDEHGNIKYWRDENSVHHVPKRILEDLIINTA